MAIRMALFSRTFIGLLVALFLCSTASATLLTRQATMRLEGSMCFVEHAPEVLDFLLENLPENYPDDAVARAISGLVADLCTTRPVCQALVTALTARNLKMEPGYKSVRQLCHERMGIKKGHSYANTDGLIECLSVVRKVANVVTIPDAEDEAILAARIVQHDNARRKRHAV